MLKLNKAYEYNQKNTDEYVKKRNYTLLMLIHKKIQKHHAEMCLQVT